MIVNVCTEMKVDNNKIIYYYQKLCIIFGKIKLLLLKIELS